MEEDKQVVSVGLERLPSEVAQMIVKMTIAPLLRVVAKVEEEANASEGAKDKDIVSAIGYEHERFRDSWAVWLRCMTVSKGWHALLFEAVQPAIMPIKHHLMRNHIFYAKLHFEAEAIRDMTQEIVKAVHLRADPSFDEITLGITGFNWNFGGGRAGFRILSSILQKEEAKPDVEPFKLRLINNFLAKIKKEQEDLADIGRSCIDIIQSLPSSQIPAIQHICNRWKGAFLEYKSDVQSGEDKERMEKETLEYYKQCEAYARANFSACSQQRLDIMLRYSVFTYEKTHDKELACEIAKKGFDEAMALLDDLNEDDYKFATLIMQLIRDNLTLWTAEDNNTPS